jgi:hypothetical protein
VVYRIHFTAEDLARTRVADTPMPLVELGLAARALQDRSQPARLDSWRRRVRSQLPVDARLALSLLPPVGYSPTFLAPALTGTPDELLEQVRATPCATLRAELAGLAERQPVPAWARQLTYDAALQERLYAGLSGLYTLLLDPYWKHLTCLFTTDRTIRMRQLVSGGLEYLLSQTNPEWMRWIPPVLEIRMPINVERDLHLEGRGVLLVPSTFGNRSIVDDEAEPQPTVTYPAGHDHPVQRLTALTPEYATSTSTAAVSALLGATRSTVLNVIAEHSGCSTKELAALAGIAPASASEHATILREAGLIRTIRHRNAALHSPTGMGIALLNGPAARR